jgi:RNA-directed DNA polymerase
VSGKRPKIQLELALRGRSKGEALVSPPQGTEPPAVKRPTESPEASTSALMEEICQAENLKEALRRVRQNKGAPGVDGMTTEELPKHLKSNWPRRREQLLKGEYHPQPVKRVEIPKANGGIRQLGIPTVGDRFIQQACLQVLQRYWDPTFSASSYGFRPGRSAHQAVVRAQEHIASGYHWVVDLDLEKFFDRVNHDRLMARVAQRVGDKRVLKLIRGFLAVGVVLEDGLVEAREEGTPQGGPLSPLLSNLVLDELDKELERRGHRFVRYADDCNIYVRSERAGKRVLASVRRYVEERLKLKINETKSAVARPAQRSFLGFSFTIGQRPRRRIGPKALKRFKERIRHLTRRVRGARLARVVEELNEYLRGWKGYFDLCETRSVFRELDTWIRHRLRTLMWAQWRNNWRRVEVLLRAGAERDLVFASVRLQRGAWHMGNSRVMNTTFPKSFFRQAGLTNLYQ